VWIIWSDRLKAELQTIFRKIVRSSAFRRSVWIIWSDRLKAELQTIVGRADEEKEGELRIGAETGSIYSWAPMKAISAGAGSD